MAFYKGKVSSCLLEIASESAFSEAGLNMCYGIYFDISFGFFNSWYLTLMGLGCLVELEWA